MSNFLDQRPRNTRAARRLAAFWADRRGNLLPLFAIVLPLLLIMIGAAADYTSAARRQETLQGISDAAVLSATQPAMMAESCSPSSTSPSNPTACALVLNQVVNVFNGQGRLVPGVAFQNITTSAVTITDTGNLRVATITWAQQSSNLFSGILGMPTIPIGGTSTAKNGSPVTLFYMLIDNTPSMAFPAQATGVTDLLNASPANYTAGGRNGGCSLACHESDPNAGQADSLFNPSNITCPTTDTAYSTWSGTKQFPCVQGQSYTIAATGNSYTSSSGAVTLKLTSTPNPGLAVGQGFYLTGLTATGSGSGNVGKLDSTTTGGAFVTITGTSGTTVNATLTSGQGTINITGGTFTSQTAAFNSAGPLVGGASGAPAGSGTGSTIGCATSICTSGTCGGTVSPQQPQYTGTFNTGASPASSSFTGFWGSEDAFALSRCLGVQLRIDLVNSAVASLLSQAATMAVTNHTYYGVDIYSIDLGNNNTPSAYNGTAVTAPSTVDVGLEPIYFWGCQSSYQVNSTCTGETGAQIIADAASSSANSIMTTNFGYATTAANTYLAPLETYQAGQTTSGGCGDPDSPIDLSVQYLYSGTAAINGACGANGTPAITKMAQPGNGLPVVGNLPEEVLYIVTDGMNDVDANGGNYPAAPGSALLKNSCVNASKVYTYYSRPLFCMGMTTDGSGNSYCTDIKKEGIKIAILYLRYNALDTNLGANQPANGYYYDIEPWQYPGNSTDTNNADYPGTQVSGTPPPYNDQIEQEEAEVCASPGLEFTVEQNSDIGAAMTALFAKAAQSVYLAH